MAAPPAFALCNNDNGNNKASRPCNLTNHTAPYDPDGRAATQRDFCGSQFVEPVRGAHGPHRCGESVET